jgi:hypothetical protein
MPTSRTTWSIPKVISPIRAAARRFFAVARAWIIALGRVQAARQRVRGSRHSGGGTISVEQDPLSGCKRGTFRCGLCEAVVVSLSWEWFFRPGQVSPWAVGSSRRTAPSSRRLDPDRTLIGGSVGSAPGPRKQQQVAWSDVAKVKPKVGCDTRTGASASGSATPRTADH